MITRHTSVLSVPYTCTAVTMLPVTPMKPRYSVIEWFLTRNSWATLLMAYNTTPARHRMSPRRGFVPGRKG